VNEWVVDATGRTVGPVVTIPGKGFPVVQFVVNGYTLYEYLFLTVPAKSRTVTWGTEQVYYTGANCTGTPYVWLFNSMVSDRPFVVSGANRSTLYLSTSTAAVPVLYHSVFTPDSNCQNFSGSAEDLAPADVVMDLSTLYTLPLHFERR